MNASNVHESLDATLRDLASRVQKAARPLARASGANRTQCLQQLADLLAAPENQQQVLAANAEDMARSEGLSAPMRDRLLLNEKRLQSLVQSMRSIAEQKDPLGEVSRSWDRPNGLHISKMRIPLGVILMIYESRPNVTLDAAALCIRSGNAVILRGGSEARATNAAFANLVQEALVASGLPRDAVALVPTQDRNAIDVLLTFEDKISLVIPRGGAELIRRVAQHSRIPVVKHDQGICHVFVDRAANLEQANNIAFNAKVQRPGVCNAMETLLVDAPVAAQFLPKMLARYREAGVEIHGCERTQAIVPGVKPATGKDWDTEFLDLIVAVRVVDGVGEAIAHIDRHGSNHTAAIVTEDKNAADRFVREVDASCVLVNASTRFNDGGELGLGAEMGISTTRLHAYGPMGAEALTTEKFVVHGHGHIRT